MEEITVEIRVDTDDLNKAQQIFDNLGFDLSTAVNIFLHNTVTRNGIPFDYEVPNEETIAAMKECEEMIKHPERYKRYSSIKEALEDLLLED